MSSPSIAVVGGGIAGLACAHFLRDVARVTVFEAAPRPGGHVNAVRVPWAGGEVDVETGFLAFHRSRYPTLMALFTAFGVETAPSGTGLAIWDQPGGLVYRHADWFRLFGGPLPLALRDQFTALLRLIFRHEKDPARHPYPTEAIGAWLEARGCDPALARQVVVPSIAALWGFQPAEVLAMSTATVLESLARFMGSGHGEPFERVAPSSRAWLDALAGSLRAEVALGTPATAVHPDGRVEAGGEVRAFDAVVLAVHAGQALALLAAPTPLQARLLGAIPYRRTAAIVHDDPAVLPPDPAAWDDYTYVLRPTADGEVSCTTWNMSRLQGLPGAPGPLLVTVGPPDLADRGWIDPARIRYRTTYAHPAMTPTAVAARGELPALDAEGPLRFCGSYVGATGSNECAVASALRVATGLGGGA